MTQAANDFLVGPVIPSSGTTLISVDFYFEDETHLEVYKGGQSAALILNTDYTVSEPTAEAATDGSITLTTAADGTSTYAIYGQQPLQRTADMQLRGDLRSQVLNLEFDRLWRAVSGINTKIQRALRISEASDVPGDLETLTDASRAGKVVGFSADGTTLAVLAGADNIEIPSVTRDHGVARWDGVAGAGLLSSYVLIDDTGKITILDDAGATGSVDIYRSGAVSYIDIDPGAADADSELIVKVDNVQRLRIDADGAVIGTGAADKALRITGTDSVKMPVGTTAQRGTGEAGDFRRNSTLAKFEGHSGSAWSSFVQEGVSARITANQGFTPVTDTQSSGSITHDFATGNVRKVTLSAAITSITLSNAVAGDTLKIIITQAAGGYAVSGWPAAVKWAGGTAPTITATNGAVDVITMEYDGTNYYAAIVQDHR